MIENTTNIYEKLEMRLGIWWNFLLLLGFQWNKILCEECKKKIPEKIENTKSLVFFPTSHKNY